MDDGAAVSGKDYTVFAYASADDPSNDDPSGKAYYLLDTEYTIGGEAWVYPEDVEVIKTVAELAARKLPTLADVRRRVGAELCGIHDDTFTSNESDYGGGEDSPIEVYCDTHDGLGFSFEVVVRNVRRTDW